MRDNLVPAISWMERYHQIREKMNLSLNEFSQLIDKSPVARFVSYSLTFCNLIFQTLAGGINYSFLYCFHSLSSAPLSVLLQGNLKLMIP